MKKKLLFLLCFFLLGLNASKTQAANLEPRFIYGNTGELPPDYDEIVLQGCLMLNIGPNAIEAGYNNNSIFIQFNQNLGYVDITVYNPYGLLAYHDVINTAVQQQVIIPITSFADGIYTIVLENATGYVDGEFEKTNN